MSPMHNPRRFGLERSSAKIMDVLIKPALPQPDITLPVRNTASEGAAAVMKSPAERIILENMT